jgi:hypothetical protein
VQACDIENGLFHQRNLERLRGCAITGSQAQWIAQLIQIAHNNLWYARNCIIESVPVALKNMKIIEKFTYFH